MCEPFFEADTGANTVGMVVDQVCPEVLIPRLSHPKDEEAGTEVRKPVGQRREKVEALLIHHPRNDTDQGLPHGRLVG